MTVTRDSQPPQLTLDGPPSAAAGGNIALHLAASDASHLSLVELRSAGTVVWSGGGAGTDLDQDIPFSLPPGLAAGEQLTLVAAAIDAAGNRGEAQLTVGVAQGASGPGYLRGRSTTTAAACCWRKPRPASFPGRPRSPPPSPRPTAAISSNSPPATTCCAWARPAARRSCAR